ncbi:hypothetical protein [Kushneria sp. TE3]|uniref:hypothetical protein n=1 Tax=Kushneria sp. TE3 TaxID=3449832 RepID=UPI003F687EF9
MEATVKKKNTVSAAIHWSKKGASMFWMSCFGVITISANVTRAIKRKAIADARSRRLPASRNAKAVTSPEADIKPVNAALSSLIELNTRAGPTVTAAPVAQMKVSTKVIAITIRYLRA